MYRKLSLDRSSLVGHLLLGEVLVEKDRVNYCECLSRCGITAVSAFFSLSFSPRVDMDNSILKLCIALRFKNI